MKNYSNIELIIKSEMFDYKGSGQQLVKWFWVKIPVTTQVLFLKATNQWVRFCMN
jgi:hypothetical protein